MPFFGHGSGVFLVDIYFGSISFYSALSLAYFANLKYFGSLMTNGSGRGIEFL